MGYTTEFDGQVTIDPPLNEREIEFLKKFNETRRMQRKNGPYYVDSGGFMGQDHEKDIENYNQPPTGQPSLWCQWTPTSDGKAIQWDGGEKFYSSTEWMEYIIKHFLCENPKAKARLPFLQGHVVNGEIEAQREDSDDIWKIVVTNNKVESVTGSKVYS